jgi:hypothetical protein
MLGIQINHFRKKLEECILLQLLKGLFLFMMGNGTLKLELKKF